MSFTLSGRGSATGCPCPWAEELFLGGCSPEIATLKGSSWATQFQAFVTSSVPYSLPQPFSTLPSVLLVKGRDLPCTDGTPGSRRWVEQGKDTSPGSTCVWCSSSVLHMADALASEIARDNEKVNQKSGMALGPWAIWTLLASIAIDKDQLQGMVHTTQRLGSQPVKKLHSVSFSSYSRS